MFASSRAASISSRMQKGVGFSLSIAKRIAMAVRARSPPESRESSCSFLPGGWALTSMPQFSGSSGSSSCSSALPPPKRRVKVSEK